MLSPVFILTLFLLLFTPHTPRQSVQEDVYKERRETMVQRTIESRGVREEAVLEAMRTVRRHLFVPPKLAAQAYADNPLPIGHEQTISQPYIVAYMTEVIKPNDKMKVLEIGTGSGYQAAVLAEIVREVYTIEIVPEHGKAAAKRLEQLGYDNVHVKIGDGYQGWEEHAPYDAIVVTAGAEQVPPPLLQQLKEGGRMVIPVGPPNMVQSLLLIQKKKGKAITRDLMPVVFVPFTRSEKN
ncbi:protein-L-isoaspartate(D-aspartate) O-methyltransferase [Pontibacter roseus]|uniref:protein-L-isoaspartate(D-aspartate) O-methyltransferase n=1 Tax=Pontibacter roseus TaxID=336989 RepID=UPI00037E71E8|nr:protein-L-isoaspartate(D-aspartate) O-methyltransferase [Pontibacter roseus]